MRDQVKVVTRKVGIMHNQGALFYVEMVAPTALEKTGFNITALRASKNYSYYYQVCFVGTPQNPTVVETGKIENQATMQALVVIPSF